MFTVTHLLITYLVICGVALYVMLFGNTKFHRHGLVGKLNRGLSKLPEALSRGFFFVFCLGSRKRANAAFLAVNSRVMRSRHPLLQVFYCVLALPTMYYYIFYVVEVYFDRLPQHQHQRGQLTSSSFFSFAFSSAILHKGFSYLFCTVALVSFVVPCVVDPGTVRAGDDTLHNFYERKQHQHSGNSKNSKFQQQKKHGHQHDNSSSNSNKGTAPKLHRYEYDGVLYDPAAFCKTCNLPRPARSKHCRICNRCVYRFDHHCAWLNNDVGQNNHGYFLLFLFVHFSLPGYVVYECYRVLVVEAARMKLHQARFVDARTRQVVEATSFVKIMHLANERFVPVAVMIFNICICLLLFGFWAYNMLGVAQNYTTNEKDKIDDVMAYLHAHEKFQAYHTAATRELQRITAENAKRGADEQKEGVFAIEKFEECVSVPGFLPPDFNPDVLLYESNSNSSSNNNSGGGGKQRGVRRSEKAIKRMLKRTYHGGIVQNILEAMFASRSSGPKAPPPFIMNIAQEGKKAKVE